MPLLLDKRQPDNAYLQEIAAFLGIDSRLNHLPHELSGGQQQRVAIARALIAKPDIIFADEPTGNLDTKSGSEVMEMLCDLRAKMNKPSLSLPTILTLQRWQSAVLPSSTGCFRR